jgi:heme oxygenase
VYNSLLDSLKIQLSEKNQYIEKSNDNFIENNRLFKQVLTNLSHVV